MVRLFLIIISLIIADYCFAQDSFDDFKARMDKSYNSFKESENKKFNDFRRKVNSEYSRMVKESWEQLEALKGLPAPKDDKPVPPVVYPEEDKNKPIKDDTKPIVEVVPVAPPAPKPEPVVPIKEKPIPTQSYFYFEYLGSKLKVRLDKDMKFRINDCSENSIAKVWDMLSKDEYLPLISDCLEIRDKYNYSDWAYLMMLKCLSVAFFNQQYNESTILMAYIYCQSGYKMRLATAEGKLFMLYSSEHKIYDLPYWNVDNEMYYPFECKLSKLSICRAKFPQESPMSLFIRGIQHFGERYSQYRKLESKRYPTVKANVRTNSNLIEFYNTYPTSYVNDDFGTRWAMYANTPLEEETKRTLYPSLKTAINGLSQKESVERILNFVQTAFEYEYDDKVWGQDRAFFAEESLFYPYCDCEDRSILFSRLVRDLVGLNVVLIYYPGHLATAVQFTESVVGDNVVLNGAKYVICDPTYIGAPVGLTMPKMDNASAKVIMLQ